METKRLEKIAESVIYEIEQLRRTSKNLLIAIDGRCAAGKTTLAAHLQDVISCNVIHMDHFFLRPEQRTQERLQKPGGNVDYERFVETVLIPIEKGKDFSYKPYDCRRQAFGESIYIQANSINIIEGSYSCQPTLRDYYNLRIFLSVGPLEQLHRIRQRNGDAHIADFKEKWIPLEEKYFLFCQVQEHSNLQYKS